MIQDFSTWIVLTTCAISFWMLSGAQNTQNQEQNTSNSSCVGVRCKPSPTRACRQRWTSTFAQHSDCSKTMNGTARDSGNAFALVGKTLMPLRLAQHPTAPYSGNCKRMSLVNLWNRNNLFASRGRTTTTGFSCLACVNETLAEAKIMLCAADHWIAPTSERYCFFSVELHVTLPCIRL